MDFSKSQLSSMKTGSPRCQLCLQDEVTGRSAKRRLISDHAGQYGFLESSPAKIACIRKGRKLAKLRRLASSADLVAFDCEWRPSSPHSAGVHVLQLAFAKSRTVYVMQVGLLGARMPVEVLQMFVRPSCTVVGFGVGEDVIRLRHLSGALSSLDAHTDIVDIQCLAGARAFLMEHGREGNYGTRGGTLDRVSQVLLGQTMNKDPMLTCSDWSASTLSHEQITYAAMDAWTTLRLYLTLAGE